MPVSNSTVRKRRRGNFVIPTDETRAAKKAAKAEEKERAAKAEGAGEEAKAGAEDEKMEEAGADDLLQLTQLLEISMEDDSMENPDDGCHDGEL